MVLNKEDLEAIAALQTNIFLKFHNGKTSNKDGFKIFVKMLRNKHAKTISDHYVVQEIERQMKANNAFSAMVLMQFSFLWSIMFPKFKSLTMGQVDMILRKYYK